MHGASRAGSRARDRARASSACMLPREGAADGRGRHSRAPSLAPSLTRGDPKHNAMELNRLDEPTRAPPTDTTGVHVADSGTSTYRSALNSPRLDAIRSRATSLSKSITLDPRETYRQQSDPDDPTHENMPLLTQKTSQGIIPVVLVNEKHPTFHELRSGTCGVCKKTCKFYCLVSALLAAAWWSDKSGCGQVDDLGDANLLSAESGPEECVRHRFYSQSFDDFLRDKLLPDCNTCSASFDHACDEPNPTTGDYTGQCPPGTDGFDCAVMERTKDAVNEAGSRAEAPPNAVLLLTLGFGWFMVTPCILCGAYCCCKNHCARCRFEAIPVVSDMVFEIVRSRMLAVVETTAFFLLAAAVFFEAQMCKATFTLQPSVSKVSEETGPLWPPYMSKSVAEFRSDDDYYRLALMGLFLLRFLMGNLANSQWQHLGKNLTGAAFSCAVFFSLWSFGFLWEDVGYCRYPTAVHHADNEISYCSIIGEGLPEAGMPAKVFMSDCEAHNSLMVGNTWSICSDDTCTPASELNVSFAQLFSPTTYTPTSGIDFPLDSRPAYADLLPSKKIEFEQWAQKQAALEARTKGVSPAVMDPMEPVECDATDLDRPCLYKAGTMIEAIQMYAEDCEANFRMRDSTLLVVTLFLLNLLELLLLLKIGLTTDRVTLPIITDWLHREKQLAGATRTSKKCSMSSWVLTHAEYSVSTVVFMFPIRLIAGVVVSCLLLSGGLASIDYVALSTTTTIVSIEQVYNEIFVPLMREGLGEILTGLSEAFDGPPLAYHNQYFDSGAELSAHAARPSFNALDDDCPCTLLGAVGTIGSQLLNHGWMAFTYLASSGRRRRLLVNATGQRRVLDEAGGCPPNSVPEQDECKCVAGFAVNVQGTSCVPVTAGDLCPGVANAYLNADGTCSCDQNYVVDGNECVPGSLPYEMEQIRDIMEKNETGIVIKCSVQYVRQYWEPLPFCIRYGGILSMIVALVSTYKFVSQFRAKALRLQALVERYFDPVTGWPKDPDVLNEADVELLTGGKRSWILDYSFLNKLPSFIGLYCGNMVCAFLTHWVVWMIILYVTFCRAIPSNLVGMLSMLTPVAAEAMIKSLVWQKVASTRQGILHPRIYAMIDVILSLISTVTGPIKTVFRVVGATICLFIHLFRADVTMMLDKAFFPLDPHYTSTTALLTALRVQYEFGKIRRTRPPDARLDHLKIYEGGMDEGYSRSQQLQAGGAIAATVATTEMVGAAVPS